jgi:hypothetical protein
MRQAILCIALILTSIGLAESADRSDACDLGDQSGTRLAGKAACVALGAGLALGLHEAGHAIVGAGDLDWSGFPNWTCTGCSRGQAQAIAVAGFALPALTAELLIDVPKVPRDHPVVAGFLLGVILHPVIYVIRNEAGGLNVGDFGNFSRGEQLALEGALLGVAAIQAARLLWWDDRFPLMLRATERDVLALFHWKW